MPAHEPFDLVCENLRGIGAIPIQEYLASILSANLSSEFSLPSDNANCSSEFSSDHNILLQAADESNLEDSTVASHGLTLTTPNEKDGPEQTNVEEDPGLSEDPRVLEIMNACEEFLPENGPPEWIYYRSSDSGMPFKWGAALRIHLESAQVFGTDQIYRSRREAKEACAQLAIKQNVLRAITANIAGRSSRAPPVAVGPAGPPVDGRPSPMSLQAWFDNLPRPLPPLLSNKPLQEIAAPSLVNQCITKARGARFTTSYFFPTEHKPPLHGCLFRLEHPGKSRSYLVDPVFAKRNDARTAACLWAIVEGVEDYIRAVGDEADARLTPKLRALAQDQILPLLRHKAPGDTHSFTYQIDRNAYGYTLIVRVGSEEHEYVSQPVYGTKADAKVAIAIVAAQRGLPELLKFRGEPTPPGYKTFWDMVQDQQKDDASEILAHATAQKRRRQYIEALKGEVVENEGRKEQKRKKMHVDNEGVVGVDWTGDGNGVNERPPKKKKNKAKASTTSGGVSLGVPKQSKQLASSSITPPLVLIPNKNPMAPPLRLIPGQPLPPLFTASSQAYSARVQPARPVPRPLSSVARMHPAPPLGLYSPVGGYVEPPRGEVLPPSHSDT